MDFLKLMRQAMPHFQAGRYVEAEPLLRKAHLSDRTHPDPLHYMGLIAAANGRMDDAIGMIERSIELVPSQMIHRRNFVVVLAKSQRPEDRDRAFVEAQKALAITPGDASIVQVYAEAANVSGRPLEAASAWQWIATHARPGDPVILFNLGTSCEQAGALGAALQAYESAVRLRPDYFEASANLAALLSRVGRLDEAIAIFRDLHNVRPDDGAITVELGALLTQRSAVSEGETLLQSAVAAGYVGRGSYGHFARALSATGRVVESFEAHRQQVAQTPSDPAAYSAVLMTAQYLTPDDPAEQLQLHRGFEKGYCAGIQPLPSREVNQKPSRLRIGYVSSDFRKHSVSFFFEPLLAAHDRSRVEIHCFDVAFTIVDDMTARLRASAEHWHEVPVVGHATLANQIRAAGIDVLIDLNGHSGETRVQMFAFRPAPLQLTYLGYPNTTGMTSIDGRITDAVADPPGTTEAFYTERLLRLPHSFGLVAPHKDSCEVSPLPMLKNGFPTLACVAAIVKVNDAVQNAWAEVLRRLPSARLLLVGSGYGDAAVQKRFTASFAQRGIDPNRLEFMGLQSFANYFALHARFDIVLDTFPFNGHTTTVQNLWMGVPVVTLAGVSHRNRMGASVLNCIGLEELIATSAAGYVDTIVQLASDPGRLAALRSSLRERMRASPLMDAPRFARDFEDLVFAAWQQRTGTT